MILTITDRGRHGRDCMVVGFTITYAVSTHHQLRCELESRSGEVYSIRINREI